MIKVDADNTNTFKAHSDTLWRHRDILFDYKAELTMGPIFEKS